ncbi:MAG: hypothetical protein L6R28_08775 [Planctomycetes bacterium]|nr:hypothetical protein [Planctomycetota bacterium]
MRLEWALAMLLAAVLCAPSIRANQDSEGFLWDLQGDGSVSDGGNDTYDGGLSLLVNEQAFPGGAQGRGDSGEIVFGPAPMGNLQVTRNVLVSQQGPGCARYVEVVENTGDSPVDVTLSLYSNLGTGQGIQSPVPPTKHGVPYSIVSQGAGRSVLAHVYAGRRQTVRALANVQDGTIVEMLGPFKVAPGKRAAFFHVIAQRRSVEEAEAFVKKLDFDALVRDLPAALRRIVVNTGGGGGLFALGDLPLYRGTVVDALQLRSGEQIFGDLKTAAVTFSGEFGKSTIPTERILSLFAAAEDEYRLVLDTGEVLTGRIAEPALNIKLRGGNELAVPLENVGRYGRRVPQPTPAPPHARAKDKDLESAADGAPEPDLFDSPAERILFKDPVFVLRDGDRITGKLAAERIIFKTLYGDVSVEPAKIRRIAFPGEGVRMPVVELADGSAFAALPADAHWKVTRSVGGEVALDIGRISGAIFAPDEVYTTEQPPEAAEGPKTPKTDVEKAIAEAEADMGAGEDEGEKTKAPTVPPPPVGPPPSSIPPSLSLNNGDIFHGTLNGEGGALTLETPFGTQKVDPAQVRGLSARRGVARGLRVTLWDGSSLPARLSAGAAGAAPRRLAFELTGGGKLSVPLDVLVSYEAPNAMPPVEQAKEIDALVAKLADPDAATRDTAQQALSGIGLGVLGVLAQHWNHKDLEARTRVRQIYQAVLSGKGANTPGAVGAAEEGEEGMDGEAGAEEGKEVDAPVPINIQPDGQRVRMPFRIRRVLKME